jgi:hypothetical protein
MVSAHHAQNAFYKGASQSIAVQVNFQNVAVANVGNKSFASMR